jgi:hypothetical protein
MQIVNLINAGEFPLNADERNTLRMQFDVARTYAAHFIHNFRFTLHQSNASANLNKQRNDLVIQKQELMQLYTFGNLRQ